MKNLFSASWPTWCTGIITGVLLLLWSAFFPDDTLTGFFESLYEWIAEGDDCPEFDCTKCLLAGIMAGAFAAACAEKKYDIQFLESGSSFSERTGRSLLWAGGGGFLLMLGSLIAGDVPLEQFALVLQMSRPAWVFVIAMLVSGVFLAIMTGERIGGAAGAGGKK